MLATPSQKPGSCLRIAENEPSCFNIRYLPLEQSHDAGMNHDDVVGSMGMWYPPKSWYSYVATFIKIFSPNPRFYDSPS